MKPWIFFLLVALAVLSPSRGYAQPERFEVGRRLRAFEAAWEEKATAENRKRAVQIMKQATVAFLTNRPIEAGKALDQARFALRYGKETPANLAWAESLQLKLASRFVETTGDPVAAFFALNWLRWASLMLQSAPDTLDYTLMPFYPVEVKGPAFAFLEAELYRPNRKPPWIVYLSPVKEIPTKGRLRLRGLPEGDYTVQAEVATDGKVLARSKQQLSLVSRLDERLGRLKAASKSLPREPATTDKETVRALTSLLEALHGKKPQETNYPAARLLAEAETTLAAIAAGKTYYGHEKTGQFWLTLATAKGPAPVRLLAPAAVKEGKPLPLVIALHGAGGSENMFFDAYGRGAIVRLCEERGWLLVATRSSFGRAAPLPEIIDEVNRLYPVDSKRVFVVGHSMGAAQAVSAAGQSPERFAGVAALGGGGAVRATEGLKDVPFFVGAGSEDFLLGGARSLRDGLKKAGVKKVEFHEYPDVEHVLVVQVGLRDVFAFFESSR